MMTIAKELYLLNDKNSNGEMSLGDKELCRTSADVRHNSLSSPEKHQITKRNP